MPAPPAALPVPVPPGADEPADGSGPDHDAWGGGRDDAGSADEPVAAAPEADAEHPADEAASAPEPADGTGNPEPAADEHAPAGTQDAPASEHAEAEPDSAPDSKPEARPDAKSDAEPDPDVEIDPGVEIDPEAEFDPEAAAPTRPNADRAPAPPAPAVGPEAAAAPPLAPRPAGLPVRPVRRIPASGERLGRFTLGEALGHGGFAHVYRAQADDGAEVALKVLTGLHDDARERFVQEAELLERLDGRGFPHFVESGLDATQPWFAMELVPGRTLRDRVREDGPLSGPEALRLARQVVDALLVLQEQRCLHRDLKPANIMVDGERAVLIDLGIAKVFDAATSTQPAGTMAYMAPELFGRRVHPRSDVYSLGLLLVYASTGALPLDLNFMGRDLVATDLVDPDEHADAPDGPPVIDRHLQSLVLAMTRYQPNHRPPLENIASVVRARLAHSTPDPTLLLTSQLVSDGVTAAEVAALPATDVLHGRGHTRMFPPGPDEAAPGPASTARTPEPWHALVYDRALMSVLTEVHADGFDGAAEQVVADHIAEIGAEVAGGRTPAEIKDWIWQAMRWQVTSPADGHSDTLRGWRAFRSPQPEPASRRAPVRSQPIPPAAATQVVREQAPRPKSYEPRKSPVKHLGPAPQPPGPRSTMRATRPMPAVQQRGGQPPSVRPAVVQPAVLPPESSGPRPPRSPQQAQGRAQAAPQPAQGRAPASPRRGAQPAAAPVAQRPQASARPGGPPQAAAAPRRRPWPVRLLGALLRWVPRLLLLAAVYVLVVQQTADTPYLSAPALAVAAFGVAVLLRVAGHRMRIWFYVVSMLVVGAVSAALWATSTGLLRLF
ncbi:protein kinase [Promicromonospora sp. NPDC050880]|uniref:serine/threonine-protein kinase n=1 Tax=Promicromonospora sp. NPDC050880 TaxID=3364406 RepID=UPI00379562B8